MRLLEQLDRPVQMRPKLHRRRLPHVARDSDAVSQIGEARCQATAGAATVRQVRCRRIMRLRSHRVAAERAPSRIRQGQPGACMWTSMLVDEGAPTHIQMHASDAMHWYGRGTYAVSAIEQCNGHMAQADIHGLQEVVRWRRVRVRERRLELLRAMFARTARRKAHHVLVIADELVRCLMP